MSLWLVLEAAVEASTLGPKGWWRMPRAEPRVCGGDGN